MEDAYFPQDSRLTATGSSTTAPEPPVLTHPPGSTVTTGRPHTSNGPHHEVNHGCLGGSTNTNPTFDKSTFQLSKRVVIHVPLSIARGGKVIVRLPPKPPAPSDMCDSSQKSADISPSVEVAKTRSKYPLANHALAPEDPKSLGTGEHPNVSVPSITQESRSQSAQTFQDDIDALLMAEIKSPIKSGGYVQVISSGHLLKIGKATDVICHKKQVERKCQLGDLEEVEIGRYYSTYPERVRRLVRLELQNFQAKFNCSHPSGWNSQEVEQEHKEWFDVPVRVVIQSVMRWRGFVDKAYTSDGTIAEHWGKMTLSKLGLEFPDVFKSQQQARGD
jgi:hypothetical protein